MPVIHRESGFRVIVYFDDHPPPHVHVAKAGAVTRIRIDDVPGGPSVMDDGGMSPHVLSVALRIVKRRHARLLLEWRRIHGS